MDETLFIEKLDNLLAGYKIANKFCSRDNTIFYIIINRDFASAVRTLRSFKAIKLYYGEEGSRFHFQRAELENTVFHKVKCIRKLIVITIQEYKCLVNLFSSYVDGVITLNAEDIQALEWYAGSSCAIHENIISDSDAGRRVYCNNLTDEGAWTRQMMFGITDLMWKLGLPRESTLDNSEITISSEIKSIAQNILRDNNISLEKLVILDPIDNVRHNNLIGKQVWNKFIIFLKDKGYLPYIYCKQNLFKIVGDSLEGGIPMEYDILFAIIRSGCGFIGVQSGITDMLATMQWDNLTKIMVVNYIVTDQDRQLAQNRGNTDERNIVNNITYLRIEHFEEDYVLKLLMDNFH